jgi:hypothetical protein
MRTPERVARFSGRVTKQCIMERPRVVGMAWYHSDDYTRILLLMEDAHRLPADHKSWLASAEQVEAEVVRSGVSVARVYFDPDAFVAWCDREGLKPNGAARTRYAQENAGGGDQALMARDRS